jgi:hypothetical protein
MASSTRLRGPDFPLKWTKGLFDHVVSIKEIIIIGP